jgi:hypothetical protein
MHSMPAALGLKTKPIANGAANPQTEDDSDISALINRLTAEVNQIAVARPSRSSRSPTR